MEQLTLTEKYGYSPEHDPVAHNYYKIQEVNLWNANEIDLSADKEHYKSLSPERRRMLDMVNAFFAPSDGIVGDNIVIHLSTSAVSRQEKNFYCIQSYIEVVHAETYNKIIQVLVTDIDRRKELVSMVDRNPTMRAKGDWMVKYVEADDLTRAERLLAAACTEGIFFTSSFLFIFYLRECGLMPGIVYANELISRDENLHRDAGLSFYQREVPLPEERVHEIVRTAVDLEIAFVDDVLSVPVEGLDPDMVKDYVRYLGDHLLAKINYNTLYNVDTARIPGWMSGIAMQQKGNFYEVRIGNYKQDSLKKALDYEGLVSGKYDEQKKQAYADPTSVIV